MATVHRVLLCSERDLRPDIAATLIERQGIEVYRVQKFADARLVGSSLGVQVILVDSQFPDAAAFIQRLRKEPATRERSIAVLTRGSTQGGDRSLLASGANAIFRLPPDAGWDERFSKLLDVPVRQQARMVVHLESTPDPEYEAVILNLSSGGMLLACDRALQVKDEFGFRFTLPAQTAVHGRGRVARVIPPTGFGVEFIEIDREGKDAILAFMRSARMG